MKHVLPLLLLASAGLGSGADSLLDRAQYMFFNRHLNPSWLDSAYAVLASVRDAEPRNERCLYLWSRIHVQKGDDAATRKEKLRCFGRAKAVAETLRQVNHCNPDGHMWWGAAPYALT